MKITPEQRAKIDSLYCERLSSNDVNFRLVDEFFNSRNTSISDTLQNEAYQEQGLLFLCHCKQGVQNKMSGENKKRRGKGGKRVCPVGEGGGRRMEWCISWKS